MVKTLVLVRHGKAQDAGPEIPDIERSLTPEGRMALGAARGFKRTFGLLSAEERENAVIWTSPARRARQTAHEVAKAIGEHTILGDRKVIESESLWEQDEELFLAELEKCNASCLIVVGHAPFVGKVTSRLSGDEISFKPGAAAALKMGKSLKPGKARLTWFVQGPKPKDK